MMVWEFFLSHFKQKINFNLKLNSSYGDEGVAFL